MSTPRDSNALLDSWLWIVLVMVTTGILGLQFQLRHPYPDSDQFYHFAVSRLTTENGLLRTLPQVRGLEWDKTFPDKEFLFHGLTSAAYYFGEEKAVRLTALLLAVGLVLLLTLLCRRCVPTVIAALIAIGFFVFDPFFFQRVFLVRPHLLAVALFIWLLYGLLRRSPWLSFLAALLYSLAYHAIHLPGLVLFVLFFTTFVWPNDDDYPLRRAVEFGISGLLLGVLLNPYFPQQLGISWAHFLFAFEAQDPAAPVGSELRRVAPWDLATRSPVLCVSFLFVVALSVLELFRSNTTQRKELLRWTFITTIFAGAALLNPRALEYLIPLTALCLAMHLSQFSHTQRWCLAALFGAALIVQSSSFLKSYFRSSEPSVNQGRLAALFAAQALPDNTAASVFNCTFNTGPYLLYARPNVSFLDLLDPRLYRGANPSGYALRNKLVHGKIADPYSTLRETFKAEYVICMRPALIEQMKADDRFDRIYPITPDQPARVQTFRLLQ